jgi:anti-anti-sigma factor
MNITHSKTGNVTIVRLEGNLDTGTSPEAQAFVDGLIGEGATRILIDFSDVGFVSSAGLRVLLMVAKALNMPESGLRICSLNQTVSQVFELTGFNKILEVKGTEAEALDGF